MAYITDYEFGKYKVTIDLNKTYKNYFIVLIFPDDVEQPLSLYQDVDTAGGRATKNDGVCYQQGAWF